MMQVKNIKNIIFDFGGVIINIDHQKVENAFISLGVDNFDELFNKVSQTELFQKLEKGLISPREFRNTIRDISGINVTDEILDFTWNQIIGDYPTGRIKLLKKIGNRYKLFILSNTNKIHYDYYITQFRKEFGFEFQSLFDNTYWSFKIGKRKPDIDSFQYVISKNQLMPEETLFVDDSFQNILAARQLNLIAYFLKPDTDITDMFEEGILKDNIVTNL
ncbi:MAG: HAD family phosphatase [Bacteroidetes bacterium]|nr:HAD family phosphatase [Bacteroidota bacterium]MBL7105325.1 HAD family phosphatase [Bacteroidales bacterium]